ncbi:MAG: extracellular solute-binding protein [Limnochordia bacterium]
MFSKKQRILVYVVGLALLVAPAALAKQTLRVQIILGAAATKYINDSIIPEFERTHDVIVQMETVNWNTRMEKLLITTAGGVPPDVFMSGAEHILELVQANLIAPLDREFATWRDRNDFFPPTFGSSVWQGSNYGVPIYTGPRTWWYRTDLFELTGLDPNSPPSTWEELLVAAKKLTRTEGSTVVRQGYDLSRWTGTASGFGKIQDYVTYLWQNDGELVDAEYQPLFHSQEGLETLQFLVELKETVRPPGYDLAIPGGSGSAFIKGAAAIYLFGAGTASEVHNIAPGLVDSVRAILPVIGKKTQVTTVFSDWLGIHPQSPNRDVAWAFVQALTQPKALVDINAELGLLSPRRSTVNEFVRRRPLVRYLYDTLNYCRAFPVYPKSVELANAFGAEYTRAIEGQAAPHTVLEEAARRVAGHS